MDKKVSNLVIKSSIIIGLIYCLLIFIQNEYLYKSPVMFSGIKFLCFFIIMSLLLILAFSIRKSVGGFIGFKEVLRNLLISILIIELLYTGFGIIYNLFIETAFTDKLKTAWLEYADNLPLGDDQKEEMKKRMIAPFEQEDAGKITVKNILIGFGSSIVVDSIVAIIISGIVKKQRPIFEDTLS